MGIFLPVFISSLAPTSNMPSNTSVSAFVSLVVGFFRCSALMPSKSAAFPLLRLFMADETSSVLKEVVLGVDLLASTLLATLLLASSSLAAFHSSLVSGVARLS